MLNPWKRRLAVALGLGAAVAVVGTASSNGQEEPKPVPKPAGQLKSPDPMPQIKLLPELPTTPVRKKGPGYNETMVDASLLPRDNAGIWVLDFAFKPLRIITVEVPGKGRRQVHYLAYRVINRTGLSRAAGAAVHARRLTPASARRRRCCPRPSS